MYLKLLKFGKKYHFIAIILLIIISFTRTLIESQVLSFILSLVFLLSAITLALYFFNAAYEKKHSDIFQKKD